MKRREAIIAGMAGITAAVAVRWGGGDSSPKAGDG
jgi:hypothetical protein